APTPSGSEVVFCAAAADHRLALPHHTGGVAREAPGDPHRDVLLRGGEAEPEADVARPIHRGAPHPARVRVGRVRALLVDEGVAGINTASTALLSTLSQSTWYR